MGIYIYNFLMRGCAELFSLVTSEQLELGEEGLDWILGIGSSHRGCLGTGTGSPGQWSHTLVCNTLPCPSWAALTAEGRAEQFPGTSAPPNALPAGSLRAAAQTPRQRLNKTPSPGNPSLDMQISTWMGEGLAHGNGTKGCLQPLQEQN